MKTDFEAELKKLNSAQKEAVEAVEGPVMVIAGPGTGKTQVLALRIANILKKTDTPADGVLCLTFTNSGVRAMRERLKNLVGKEAGRVTIATFHAFAGAIIEEFHEHLNLVSPPSLMDDRESILLADRLLEERDWKHLRTRSGGAHNFRDLRSLISFLKREGLSAKDFIELIEMEISSIKNNPESFSTRGKTKGSLKSTILAKLESLERTLEAGYFYEAYEEVKKEENLVDYEDVLNLLVRLVEESDEARASIAERFLYILVDEHQDSSAVQNRFLEAVWGEIEKPNIFVVGDDRQLIYSFNGASVSHFEKFLESFPGTKLITLTENYRSTQTVLNIADALLESRLAKGKLQSQSNENHPLKLVEAEFERDEILAAGLSIKEKIDSGLKPEDCAILVPKNYQVKSAVAVLKDLGLPVASHGKSSFFGTKESRVLMSALRVINEPSNGALLGELLLEPMLNLNLISVQKFIRENGRKLDLEKLISEGGVIGELGEKLIKYTNYTGSVYELIQAVSKSLFFDSVSEHKELLRQVEVVRTLVHLALSRLEKNENLSLRNFIEFVDRLEQYGEDIPLAVFSGGEGVRVMTLHSSKGLEFDFVWIAHLDERSLMKGKSAGFSLPEKLSSFANKKDEETARRELYVAITRAKRFCTLSFALNGYTGGELKMANIISEMEEGVFEKQSALETENLIKDKDPLLYVSTVESEDNSMGDLISFVKEEYKNQPISVTHLNNFFDCPWKWYFRNFLRLPEPENEALLFGNFAHALVERSVIERRIVEDFEPEFLKLKIFDERLITRFTKSAQDILEKFGANILPFIETEAVVEKRLKIVDEHTVLEITGSIDLLEKMEEGLRISDFKTGRVKKEADYIRQIAMYSYLLLNQRKPEKPYISRLIFLEAKDKDYIAEIKTSPEDLKQLQSEIAEYDQSLESGEWVRRECTFKPNNFARECEYCALKKRLFN